MRVERFYVFPHMSCGAHFCTFADTKQESLRSCELPTILGSDRWQRLSEPGDRGRWRAPWAVFAGRCVWLGRSHWPRLGSHVHISGVHFGGEGAVVWGWSSPWWQVIPRPTLYTCHSILCTGFERSVCNRVLRLKTPTEVQQILCCVWLSGMRFGILQGA